jgi:hypothetical protein
MHSPIHHGDTESQRGTEKFFERRRYDICVIWRMLPCRVIRGLLHTFSCFAAGLSEPLDESLDLRAAMKGDASVCSECGC